MKDIVLVGYGGHAKSVADCIERGGEYRIVGYTDMSPSPSPYRYLGTDDALRDCYAAGCRCAAVCVGYLGKGALRERLYAMLREIGFELPVISDPSAIVSASAEVGEGTFIGKGAVINAEARVGRLCIINTMALVEHECRVEDFVHVAVAAVLCGQVSVGRAAFIGANATVIQCRSIAPGQIVPAGATIR